MVTALAGGATGQASNGLPPVRHVWIVMLENEGYASAFAGNPNPYLPSLPKQGGLIPNYYGIGHQSLPNYVALLGGESPTPDTQADCPTYTDVQATSSQDPGQVQGNGCVYPASRITLADQLSALRYTWKGYMEDLMVDPARDEPVTCAKPGTGGTADQTQRAESTAPNDQYAARHDPFMYYHSIIDSPVCSSNVVRLQSPTDGLSHDLVSLGTTPNLSFVVPNLCNDGHDGPPSGCASPDIKGSSTGGLAAVDDWLSVWIPQIVSSPAYRQDGMVVITFDEAPPQSDSSRCCNEMGNPSDPIAPGGTNAGGGQVGAVVLSPFIKPGTTTQMSYNHYSLLRTLEEIFHTRGGDDGAGHLGYASNDKSLGGTHWNPGQFGADVFTNPGYVPPPPSQVGPFSVPGLGAALPVPGVTSATPYAAVPATVAAPEVAKTPSSPAPAPTPGASPSPGFTPFDRRLLDTPLPSSGGAPLLFLLVLAPLLALGAATTLLRRRTG